MAEISRKALFGKLNKTSYQALENATIFCKLRGNPYVELVHWLHQLVQLQDSDLHRVLRHWELDLSRLAGDLTRELDGLPRGATAACDLSAHVEEAVERGWVYSSLLFQEQQIRTGHLLVGILKTPGLRHVLTRVSDQFGKIKVEELGDNFTRIVGGSPEDAPSYVERDASCARHDTQRTTHDALDRFSRDLTEQARKGELDPIVGRDREIRQVMDILMRRRQNNPILTGEAGVGKTAVVEGFAQRIASGDVPPAMKDVALHVLDIGLLQAGAGVKGEFENRLRQVIEEVQSSPRPIILFIDEAHTLIGAGGSAGTGDAANLLKPALARGTLRTIAATTWAEYKRYIEKDPALTRRFQVVKVSEPQEELAVTMMRRLAPKLEKHHGVQITDEALLSAVRLSQRYIPDRQLPDKSVSLLDTACARAAVSQFAVPPEVEDCRHRIEALETELSILAREAATGTDHATRDLQAREALAREQTRLSELQARWTQEKELVGMVLDLRARLCAAEQPGTTPDAPAPAPPDKDGLLAELKAAQQKLGNLQGDRRLILPAVDAQAVGAIVSEWTGIPVGNMVRNEIEAVLGLARTLQKRVIGQDHALEAIAKRIQTSRARIENPHKPIAVMLLAGPSGVGKTETALALADALYGGEQSLITINMSEFQEPHTVSTLKGAPPGYVGYGEGGILTEAVRRRPYSVVLLDEVEKAHPDVHEIFFQVFDQGRMEDAEGRLIDFRNTIILLTTNVGSDLILKASATPRAPEALAALLRKPLLEVFPAALLGRMTIVPYRPLPDEMLRQIVRLQLDRIGQRVRQQHQVPFTYEDDVVSLVAARCTEVESGARMVDAILTHTVLPQISQELLTRMLEDRATRRIHLSSEDAGISYSFD